MIEQALQTVKKSGVKISNTNPDKKGNLSTYKTIKTKRKENKKDPKSRRFTIDKQFSSSSRTLAKNLSRFNKVLDYLEAEIPTQKGEETAMFAGLNIPKGPNKTVQKTEKISPKAIENKNDNSNIKSNEKDNGQQLELDLFPKKKGQTEKQNSNVPLEIKNIEEPQKQSLKIKTIPSIDIGIKLSDFKMHNIMTDEIIKSVTQTEPRLKVVNISERFANRLAKETKKQLAAQPHAIATNEDSVQVKVLDEMI